MKAYQVAQTGKLSTLKTLSYMKNYNDLRNERWTSTLECMARAFYQVAGKYVGYLLHNIIFN